LSGGSRGPNIYPYVANGTLTVAKAALTGKADGPKFTDKLIPTLTICVHGFVNGIMLPRSGPDGNYDSDGNPVGRYLSDTLSGGVHANYNLPYLNEQLKTSTFKAANKTAKKAEISPKFTDKPTRC